MRFDSKVAVITPGTEETHALRRQPVILGGAAQWLWDLVSRRATPGRSRPLHFALVCAGIFLLALGVRALHWQDSYSELTQKGQWMASHARHYKTEARRMLKEGGILFPRDAVDPGDARLILHPPGYPAFIAGIFAVAGDSDFAVTLAQIIFDAICAVLIFMIAAEFFNYVVAAIAGVLASLSPHFAHYSLWTSPDTLCVLPILAAVYLTIKTIRKPRLLTIIAAGALIGASCWLRANALLLAPFLAVVVSLLIERGRRLRFSVALIGAGVLVVSPITIRNWVLFHHFIPISIAGGENLIVGIADFDKENRFGMPASDAEVGPKEAVWYNRPDYAGSLWLPDGVERDQARFTRGLEVIRANPRWYAGAVLQRAFFMLRYNEFGRPHDWPFNTCTVPIVAAEPAVMHSPSVNSDTRPDWSSSPKDLSVDGGAVVSPDAEVAADQGSQILRITSDDSQFGNQFATAPITVMPRSDYLVRLHVATEHRSAAVKVTSSDLRIALASEILAGNASSVKLTNALEAAPASEAPIDSAGDRSAVQIVFASGDHSDVRVAVSNNGGPSDRSVIEVGQIELFRLGETPYQWTRYPRSVFRGIQKNLYKTNIMLPLVIAGALLLVGARKGVPLVVLMAVPAYYIVAQSPLSTEYRYILAIHYFLFVFAAVTLTAFVAAVAQASRQTLIWFATHLKVESEMKV